MVCLDGSWLGWLGGWAVSAGLTELGAVRAGLAKAAVPGALSAGGPPVVPPGLTWVDLGN